ncbi:MAG: 2-isopropylmalate synthase [Alphaproteobacteria bacterium TMED87]|nr:2-isopropylmalate synthase [Rhodospirillaceae bacterium]OUV09366.1 MAG: 2-isopropylmalate synthase [Alphaproteobacteria bacterium TMED87]
MAKDEVVVFDTTLRDGEQSPGASMNKEEKVKIATLLEQMKVDVIEAGFAIASRGDFDAVRAVAGVVDNSIVASLARASKGDIETAAEAIKPARRGRIHTFIATSPLHMKFKLKMDQAEVYDAINESVKFARKFVDDVEWSAEDGTRTDLDFLCRCVEAAINSGATTINIPDTVGYTIPREYHDRIAHLMNNVPNIDKAILSVHCHNDLGLAVANSLAAVEAGARQVECTVNGLGERAGNAAMEEIVMALNTRNDFLPYKTSVDTKMITQASNLVSTITGFAVQPNKAIVGANAFAHESGIHQDGVLKHSATYEIMSPESVGLKKSNLVMGKHSGRHAFSKKLKELGYDFGQNAMNDAFQRFKDLADKKKEIYDEDIRALVDEEIRVNDRIKFISLQVVCGSKVSKQTAEIELSFDGKVLCKNASGDGPVDATFNAIKDLTFDTQHLDLYQVNAVTKGTDAQAEVTVKLKEGGKTVMGQGADTDTLVASAKAYINALNKLLVKREKKAPEAVAV